MSATNKPKIEQINQLYDIVDNITGNGTLAPEKTMMELKSDIETEKERLDNMAEWAVISGRCSTGNFAASQNIPFNVIWTQQNITYDPTDRKFIIHQNGIYRITMNPFKNSGAGAFRVRIGKNNLNPTSDNFGMCYSNSSVYETLCLNSVIPLVQNDFIVFRLSEGTLYAGEEFNQFAIERIR